MKPDTKRTLRNVFASLIQNDAAIDGAKTAPWWVGLILFILGTFIPVIPLMVTASKAYGASFVSSYTYGYDQALVSCGIKLKAEGYSLTVNDKAELVAKKGDEVIQNTWFDNGDLSNPIAFYNTTIDGVTQRALDVYYSDRPYSNKAGNGITDMVKVLDKKLYGIGSTDTYNADVHSGSYTPSYLILYKTGSYSKIFKHNTSTAASAMYTGMDWKHVQFQELLDYTINVEGIEANVNNYNYVVGSFNNWKNVFNRAYLTQKLNSFWFTSGLYYGIFVGLGLFMGLMMWLLTRGKRNPNRNLTLWVTVKISWWIDVAPGILGMILGFVWPAAAGIGYIVLIGLRTMWLSMRQLNPAIQ